MNTRDFLSTVLSDEGYYCVIGLKNNNDRKQKFYDSIDSMLETATNLDAEGYDAYFGLGTFTTDKTRKTENVNHLKALFLDLDCGVGKPYKTQFDALTALQGFRKAYNLPKPTSVVNSGRGLHIYWALTRPHSRAEWLPVAERLKSACITYGLEADPVVTADAARILRVPNTRNFKATPAIDVKLVSTQDTLVDLQDFADKLPEGAIPVPLPDVITTSKEFSAEDKADMDAVLNSGYAKKFSKLAKASMSGGGCGQIRKVILQPNEVSYPEWFHALSIAKHCDDAEHAIKLVSARYDGYSPEETRTVVDSIDKPHLCATFKVDSPEGCKDCPYSGKIKSPIKLCMEVKEAENNTVVVPVDPDYSMPEGEVEIATDVPTKVHTIPDYPSPYFRGEGGGVYKKIVNDGVEDRVLVYKRDLYLTKRLEDPIDGPMFGFAHHTAREGIRTFVASGVELCAKEAFRKVMGMNDIFLLSKEADEIMAYISKWIEKLKDPKQGMDLVTVKTQFGWSEDHKSFLIGDREVFADKIVDNPPGGRTAQYFSQFRKKGTLEKWKRITAFYNRPGFEEHQMMFGVSFGSPLMEFVPNISGAIYHLTSSETGYGKTTGMWGGASVWGVPKRLVLKAKDTGNSIWNRAEVYKNIPLYVDELSNLDGRVISDFAYAISDGEQRNRQSNAGQNLERYRGFEWKLMAGTAANVSLLETIATWRTLPKGEAGRVMESMVTKKLAANTKDNEAAEALGDALENNCGLAGEVYIQHILNNLPATRKLVDDNRKRIIVEAGLDASARHWSSGTAVIYSGCEIAKQLGLIDWDLDALWAWIIKKLKELQGDMDSMTMDIEDIISQFYNDHPRGILRIKSCGDVPADMENLVLPDATPTFKWVGRHEYDVDKFYVCPAPLKQWCVKRGYNYGSVRGMMISQMNGRCYRMRLGRGSNLDTGSQHIIEVTWGVADDTRRN